MIIDASVATKWLVMEEGTERAEALLGNTELMAPTLIHSEVANGLRKKQRANELDYGLDMVTLMEVIALTIQTVDEVPVMGRALLLALELRHSVYDCVYLALAEQLDRELVTADLKFLEKVRTSSKAKLVRAL